METIRDVMLEEKITNHLMQDQRLAGQAINITVNEGYVELTGVVDTEEHRHLAVEMAEGISGVHAVEDLLEVRESWADD